MTLIWTKGKKDFCDFYEKVYLPDTFWCFFFKKKIISTQSYSHFHMKITASVTKTSRLDRRPCYLHSPIFFSYKSSLFFCRKIKSCCHRYFPQQIRQQITVQWYLLRDHSSARIGFNMVNKYHTLPIVYTVLI